MPNFTQILQLVDQGIDPNFVASLAGLSLAAAAFYAQTAANILKENYPKLIDAEKELFNTESRSERAELPEELTEGMPVKKKVEMIKKTISDAEIAQKSLIKAFLIFVYLVVYTISFDQIINYDTSRELLKIFGLAGFNLTIVYIDNFTSIIFLWFAGKNLWLGAKHIGSHFNVNFENERQQLAELRRKFSSIVTK